MTETHVALLDDRAVLRARGGDARPLLQRLVTGNVDAVASGHAVYALLLTPQGKFLFDFFLVADPADAGAVLIDCAASRASELLKRLALYRLRADAVFEDASADLAVCAVWGDLPGALGLGQVADRPGAAAAFAGGTAFIDPRLAALGARAVIPCDGPCDGPRDGPRDGAQHALEGLGAQRAGSDAYRAFAVSAGVPDGARDIRPEGDFPIECNLDLLNGIDFRKGCFVGQEVASRAHRKGRARKRLVIAHGEGPLPAAGCDVTMAGARVGSLAGGSAETGLALVFLDRVAKAQGSAAEAGGVKLRLTVPAYADFRLDVSQAGA